MGSDSLTVCRLGDIARFRNGKSLSPSSYAASGRHPVFGSNGQIARTHELLCVEPVVVVGRVGAFCGSVHRCDESSWVTDNAIVVEAQDGADFGFLYYLLKSMDLNRAAIGSAQPLVTQSGLRTLEVAVPPISRQRRIARILESFDDKIELNRRMNRTLESIARALFKSWFIDFDPVRKKMECGDPEVPNEIAHGWNATKLAELVVVVRPDFKFEPQHFFL
jgi:restriction endonuclease S subunit